MKLNPDRNKTPEERAWLNGYLQGVKNGQAQERVPLTEEQAMAVWDHWCRNKSSRPIDLIRAVEQAHGIKPLNASLSGQPCCIKTDAEK